MASPPTSDEKPAAQEGDQLVTVHMTENFYKDSYSRILFVLLLSITLNIGLVSTALYVETNPPKPKYFATSISGRITPLAPLEQPNQSESAIFQWANQAVLASFSYNFVNYRSELESASNYFTRSGWEQFLQTLRTSNDLETVKQRKLIVSAVATKAPVLLKKGLLGGSYSWRIQMPLLVTYQSSSEYKQSNRVVTILVQRVSTTRDTPRGIRISQYVIGSAEQVT